MALDSVFGGDRTWRIQGTPTNFVPESYTDAEAETTEDCMNIVAA